MRKEENNNSEQQAAAAYVAPQVRMVEVRVEKGFAVSDGDMESYTEGDGWS